MNSPISDIRSRPILLAVVLATVSWFSIAEARTVVVKDDAQFAAALLAAKPGDTLALSPGEFAPVIHDFHGAVTITNAVPATPATLTSLAMRGSSGVSIVGLTFSTEKFPAASYGAGGTTPFQIMKSSNITLANLNVHGSTPGSLATDKSGITIRDSDHVTVSGSNFHHLHFAILHLDDTFLTFKNNDFHELRDDAMRGGGSSNVVIEGNHCHNNHPDGALDQDHPDCIQFWTYNTKAGAHDITIVGNRYERGQGHATQFIFLGNEAHMLYDHITIKDNVSIGSLWNAIRIAYAHDVTISNNQVGSLCAPESGQTNVAWIATKDVDGLVLKNNIAGAFMKLGGTAVTASHNSTSACTR